MNKYFHITFLLLLAFLFSCRSESNNESYYNENSEAKKQNHYEEKKLSLEEEEKLNPLRFLSVDFNYRKNLLGEWVFEGNIHNSATIATFKDVQLKFYFYTKTETLLGSETHTVYEYFKPNKSKFFKIKTYAFQVNGKPKMISCEVIGAKNI